MSAFRERIVAMHETLARTLTREMGKPIVQARAEITGARPHRLLPAESRGGARREACSTTRTGARRAYHPGAARRGRQRVGVELSVLRRRQRLRPALLAGNAVLYKPSEYATLTGLAIAELLHEAGVPSDVFVPVIGDGASGAALVGQPVDGVFFTGSYATGATDRPRPRPRLVHVQLELGGKDPIYVCDDVDVAAVAAAVADGAFYNTGQSCCSVERIYVHARSAARSSPRSSPRCAAFASAIRSTRRRTSAPLARRAQLDVLETQVADATARARRSSAAAASSSARQLSSRRPCSSTSTTR